MLTLVCEATYRTPRDVKRLFVTKCAGHNKTKKRTGIEFVHQLSEDLLGFKTENFRPSNNMSETMNTEDGIISNVNQLDFDTKHPTMVGHTMIISDRG
jgi:hypothetical protein